MNRSAPLTPSAARLTIGATDAATAGTRLGVHMGVIHIEGDIVINRPVETVFDFVADESNEPRYNPQMLSAEKVSNGPIGLGTRFRARTASRGRPIEMTIEMTAYDRPRRLASLTQMVEMDIRGTLVFESSGDGTRMQWSWDVKPRGVYRLLGPLVGFMGHRQERRIWTGLKHYLEAQRP